VRGDVNADGGVSIIDAQQIARFSVGLSAATRINGPLATFPPVERVEIDPPSSWLAIGTAISLTAIPRDSAGASLAGCAGVTWSSSAPQVAAVSGAGIVTGMSQGTAVITATQQGKVGNTTIVVAPKPAVSLALLLPASGARIGKVLATQPVVELRDADGNRAASSTLPVTVTVSGGGALEGAATINPSGGLASFSNLQLLGPTGGFTLTYSAPGLSSISQTIRIALGQLLVGSSNPARTCADCEISVLDESGALVRRVGTDMNEPDLSPDGRSIVFKDNASRLKVLTTTDSLVRVLRAIWALWPQWSPDASRVAYIENSVDGWEVFTIKADGTDERRVTTNGLQDAYPSWAPDGASLIWTQAQGHCVNALIVGATIGTTRRQIAFPGDCLWYAYPRFSPDGTRLAVVVRTNNLWIANADGTGYRSIHTSACELGPIVWSPDGDQIAFSGCDAVGNREVLVIRSDGTGLRNVTNTPTINERVFSWR
jgi:hypothetical protein